VLKLAIDPTHALAIPLSAVAVVFVKTVKVAQLDTELQAPVTFTQYWSALAAETFGSVKQGLVAFPIALVPLYH